jgi:hypothetical protein
VKWKEEEGGRRSWECKKDELTTGQIKKRTKRRRERLSLDTEDKRAMKSGMEKGQFNSNAQCVLVVV